MLLAFDLDNTIITQDNRLPRSIHRAIQASREAGHAVTVLTGRTEASALPFLEELGVTELYSVNHGALVVGPGGETLQRAVIDAGRVGVLLETYSEAPGLEYSCVVGDTLYVRDPDDKRWNWAHTLDQRIAPFTRYEGEDADKIVFSCPDTGVGIYKEITERFPDLVLYLWEDHFLEITGANGHKGAALELIAERLGVLQRDTVAFGDGVNDVTMMQWAGHGVAVGPFVHPDVLAAADEHIPSPEEDGVAEWLEAHVLAVNKR